MTHLLGQPGSLEGQFGVSLNVSTLPNPTVAPVVEGIAHELQVVRSVYSVNPASLEFEPPEQVGKVLDRRDVSSRQISAADIGSLGVDMAILPFDDWRRSYDELAEQGVATGIAVPNGLSNAHLVGLIRTVVDLSSEAPARLVVKGDMPKPAYDQYAKEYYQPWAPDVRYVHAAVGYVMLEHSKVSPGFGRHREEPDITRPDFYFEQPHALLAGYTVAPSNVRMIVSLDAKRADVDTIVPLTRKIAAQAAAIEPHVVPATAA